jgi:Domain of unknown function (DUF4418)
MGASHRITPVRVAGAALLAAGATLAVIPHFQTCAEAGAPCIVTARWEIPVGAAMAIAGLVIVASSSHLVQRLSAIAAGALAGLAIALPTSITGLCVEPGMRCHVLLEPTVILLSAVAGMLSLAILGLTLLAASTAQRPEPAA